MMFICGAEIPCINALWAQWCCLQVHVELLCNQMVPTDCAESPVCHLKHLPEAISPTVEGGNQNSWCIFY